LTYNSFPNYWYGSGRLTVCCADGFFLAVDLADSADRKQVGVRRPNRLEAIFDRLSACAGNAFQRLHMRWHAAGSTSVFALMLNLCWGWLLSATVRWLSNRQDSRQSDVGAVRGGSIDADLHNKTLDRG
jgi:hypothetical protein